MSNKILSFTQDSLSDALDGVRCLSGLGPELIAEQVFAAIARQPEMATKVDEQAEFENWRSEQIAVLERNGYPDGARAFYRLGSVQWSGWQARAMLAAAPAAPAPVPQEPAGEDVRGRLVAAFGTGRWLREYDALVAERDAMRARVDKAVVRIDAFLGDDMDMPPHSLEALKYILAGGEA